MCGRFTLKHSREELAEYFDVQLEPLLAPRLNIAPTQPVLIVRENPHLERRELAHVVWGLIPTWSDDPKVGSHLINARAETVAQKPAFRHAFRRRRCLIPTSGFYEWCKLPPDGLPSDPIPQHVSSSRSGDGGDFFSSIPPPGRNAAGRVRKQPYLIGMRSGDLFAFGGLWEMWHGPNGEFIESCTIITTDANALISDIHDRMPVIIPPENYGEWLDLHNDDTANLHRFLKPYPAEAMEKTPMSPPREELKRGLEL